MRMVLGRGESATRGMLTTVQRAVFAFLANGPSRTTRQRRPLPTATRPPGTRYAEPVRLPARQGATLTLLGLVIAFARSLRGQ